jgi:striatin 1/3/4
MEFALGGAADDEGQRNDLKSFLDQCQAEFTYLMITPANPLPPRESPPLPLLEDLRDSEGYGLPGQQALDPSLPQALRAAQNSMSQNMTRPVPSHTSAASSNVQGSGAAAASAAGRAMTDLQAPQMVRSTAEHAPMTYPNASDWPTQVSITPLADDAEESETGIQTFIPDGAVSEEGSDKQQLTEADGWDFSEGGSVDAPPHVASSRPDTEGFPNADSIPKSPSRAPPSHRRKSSSGMAAKRRSTDHELSLNALQKAESSSFKLRFGLRGHLDTVRTVIFSGGGSPGEPEICTAGDDGMIKRFHIPDRQPSGQVVASDLDVTADFTHRGHSGSVMSLTSWSPAPNFSTGGRAQGDGWIFSGGQDATIRVWERGRVDPKATLEGHTDAVWTVCVLPATLGAIFGPDSPHGTPDRILLASGAADGTIKLWAISAPPQMTSPQPQGTNRGGRAGGGRVRGNSMSSGSQFASSPQPTTASSSPFHSTLVHSISRTNADGASPTCIAPLSSNGSSFVVSYSDAAIIAYDTRTGEEIGSMASLETYDGTTKTSVNSVVATTVGLEQSAQTGMGAEEDIAVSGGPTGGSRQMAGSGVEGVIISGHEDQYVRFFDANSGTLSVHASTAILVPNLSLGQCTYSMLAHPAAISSLSLSPDGRELVSAGHDASLRFWSLEKRSCTQEITSHRVMRGEGVCSVVWSSDGRWVVSGGGDGVVKVFAR